MEISATQGYVGSSCHDLVRQRDEQYDRVIDAYAKFIEKNTEWENKYYSATWKSAAFKVLTQSDLQIERIDLMKQLHIEKEKLHLINSELSENFNINADKSELFRKIDSLPLDIVDKKGLAIDMVHWNTGPELSCYCFTSDQDLTIEHALEGSSYFLTTLPENSFFSPCLAKIKKIKQLIQGVQQGSREALLEEIKDAYATCIPITTTYNSDPKTLKQSYHWILHRQSIEDFKHLDDEVLEVINLKITNILKTYIFIADKKNPNPIS